MDFLAVLLVTLVGPLVHWAFARYSYEVAGDTLRMRRRILRVVPWGRRTVRFSDVELAKAFSPGEDWRYGWDLFGNVVVRRSVIVRLKGRRMGVLRWGILITPDDPDAFVAEVNRLIAEVKE